MSWGNVSDEAPQVVSQNIGGVDILPNLGEDTGNRIAKEREPESEVTRQ